MTTAHITLTNNMATLTFPQALLEELGIVKDNEIQINEVQIEVIDQTLIARTVIEAEHAEKVGEAADFVFEKYGAVFAALAEGAG